MRALDSKLVPSALAKLQLAAANHALAFVPSDDMPGLAVDLLEAGADSEDFANLAGGTRLDHPADLRQLFELGLEQCAVRAPSRLEAAAQLKLHFASQVAIGEVPPADGAAKIVTVFQEVEFELPPSKTHVGDVFGIARLYGLWDSLADLDQADDSRRRSIEREILDECRAIAGITDGARRDP